MIINTRFASTCPKCGSQIEAGAQANWRRGQLATHVVCPAAAPLARIAIEDAGVYVLPDGALVKVKANLAKTKTYASRLVEINAERVRDVDGERVNFKWVYEPGLIARVAADGRKMNLQEAKQWGLRYGRCLRCGLKIVAANSVLAGIGPVCIKWFGETQLERIDRLEEAELAAQGAAA